jgi:phenylalanyl-tRNA synthetase alpha chain
MKKQFKHLKEEFDKALQAIDHRDVLDQLKNEYLGRKGKLAELMKELKDLSAEKKKEAGKNANSVKTEMETLFADVEKKISLEEDAERGQVEWVDITEPGNWLKIGHLHPVSSAIEEITDIFSNIGFTRVRAPEIDWDHYTFESLNIPKDHPARDGWETFFVAPTDNQTAKGEKGCVVLTPHTSNSQVREMEKGVLPIRMINIGRCYRRESSVSHIPMFHQFEGLMVDKDITIAHLKGALDHFAKSYFGSDRVTRLRPHHFRFTEPSFEVDISCDACGAKEGANCRLCKSGWLELGGAGMVHPNVLKAGGVDPEKYTGFAFGWGVERTLMMREGIKIDDIRVLYKNDLRFVKQF